LFSVIHQGGRFTQFSHNFMQLENNGSFSFFEISRSLF